MPGGETVRNLVARCRDLLKRDSELSREESARVTLTLKRYKWRAAFTGSVVYAVRLDDSLMQDETRSRLWEIAQKEEHLTHLRALTPLSRFKEIQIIKSIGPERIVGKWQSYLP